MTCIIEIKIYEIRFAIKISDKIIYDMLCQIVSRGDRWLTKKQLKVREDILTFQTNNNNLDDINQSGNNMFSSPKILNVSNLDTLRLSNDYNICDDMSWYIPFPKPNPSYNALTIRRQHNDVIVKAYLYPIIQKRNTNGYNMILYDPRCIVTFRFTNKAHYGAVLYNYSSYGNYDINKILIDKYNYILGSNETFRFDDMSSNPLLHSKIVADSTTSVDIDAYIAE